MIRVATCSSRQGLRSRLRHSLATVLRGAGACLLPVHFSRRTFERVVERKLLRNEPFSWAAKGEWTVSTRAPQKVPAFAVAAANWRVEGKTLVLNDVPSDLIAVKRARNFLERELHSRLRVSAFLSPTTVAGFQPHFDGADLLVFQMQGQKIWSLYEKRNAKPTVSEVVAAPRRSPVRVELKAGDALFLRRGVVHKVRNPHHARTSVHLAMSFDKSSTKARCRLAHEA